jgi:hypothetical protein
VHPPHALWDAQIWFSEFSAEHRILKSGFPPPVVTETFSADQAEVKDLQMLK